MTSETGGSGAADEGSTGGAMPLAGTNEGATQSPEAAEAMVIVPPVEGRRTQLKIVRENIQFLSNDLEAFRRKHTANVRKLEKQVAGLRRELAAQTVSKDVGSFRKSHEVSTLRLEKQIANLRKELAAMKADIAKDVARGRARQEAALAKFLARINKRPSKAVKSKSSKPVKSKKKR